MPDLPTKKPDPNSFQSRYFNRLGDLGYPFVAREILEDMAKKQERLTGAGHELDPRSDIPIEDQRGMTLPELDLQARYLRSRGAYDPLPPPNPWEPITPMGRELGVHQIEPRAAAERRKNIILGTARREAEAKAE